LATRKPFDFYPTPTWAIEALLNMFPPCKDIEVVEPCAGNGAICKTLIKHNYKVHGVEIREEAREYLSKLPLQSLTIGNWLSIATLQDPNSNFSIVTNPPFVLAFEFAKSVIQDMNLGYVALLLRLGFLASKRRHSFFKKYPPTDLLILSKRPSFTIDNLTDSYDYGWFIWERGKTGCVSFSIP